MTARVPLEAKRRPRRELGEVLTFVLHCPLCLPGAMGIPPGSRVVAYREKTVRMECLKCQLRWSVNVLEITSRLFKDGAPGWGDASKRIGEQQGWQALEAFVRGSGRSWEAFQDRFAARHASRSNDAVDNGTNGRKEAS